MVVSPPPQAVRVKNSRAVIKIDFFMVYTSMYLVAPFSLALSTQ